jgi:hypothetical protein
MGIMQTVIIGSLALLEGRIRYVIRFDQAIFLMTTLKFNMAIRAGKNDEDNRIANFIRLLNHHIGWDEIGIADGV